MDLTFPNVSIQLIYEFPFLHLELCVFRMDRRTPYRFEWSKAKKTARAADKALKYNKPAS
jgi:hypothetical protein